MYSAQLLMPSPSESALRSAPVGEPKYSVSHWSGIPSSSVSGRIIMLNVLGLTPMGLARFLITTRQVWDRATLLVSRDAVKLKNDVRSLLTMTLVTAGLGEIRRHS